MQTSDRSHSRKSPFGDVPRRPDVRHSPLDHLDPRTADAEPGLSPYEIFRLQCALDGSASPRPEATAPVSSPPQ